MPAGHYTLFIEGYSLDAGKGELRAQRNMTFAVKEADNLFRDSSFKFGLKDGTWSGGVDLDALDSNSGGKSEVWGKGHGGVTAINGSNQLERDRDHNQADAIWQDILAEDGQVYETSFNAMQCSNDKEAVVIMWLVQKSPTCNVMNRTGRSSLFEWPEKSVRNVLNTVI